MAESHEHITCQEVVELVTDYLEGTLGPHETALFEQHLNFCDGCDWYVDQMRTTIATVGRIERGGRAARAARQPARRLPRPGALVIAYKFLRDRRHRRLHALRLAAAGRRARARGSRRRSSPAAAASTRAACSDLPLWLGRELYEIELDGADRRGARRRSSPRAGGCCAGSTRGTTTRAPPTRATAPTARTGYAAGLPDWEMAVEPATAGGPASLGFIAARIAEERDGLDGLPRRARAPGRVARRGGSAL